MQIAGERILIFGDSLSSRHSSCGNPRSADQYNVVEGTNRTANAPGDLLASYLLAQGAAAARVDARVCRSAWNFWQGEDTSKLLAADLAWRPSLVVVMLGTNDIGLNLTKDGEALARLVKVYRDAGAKVVAIGPPSFPPGPLDRLNNGSSAVYQMLRKGVGADGVVDARPLSLDLLSAAYRTVAMDGGVHFTSAGAAALAPRLAKAVAGLQVEAATRAAAWKPLGLSFGLTLGLGLLIGGLVWVGRRRSQLDGAEADEDQDVDSKSFLLPADFGKGWMTASARDLVKISVAFGGFDRKELARRLALVRGRGDKINTRTVESVLQKMRAEWKPKAALEGSPYNPSERDCWFSGGCLTFAKALQRKLGRGARLVDVVEPEGEGFLVHPGRPHHVLVEYEGKLWDAEGAHSKEEVLAFWSTKHNNLLLEPHQAKRAKEHNLRVKPHLEDLAARQADRLVTTSKAVLEGASERIWVVRLPSGLLHVASDSRPDNPRRAWIYSRFVSNMVAEQTGGIVEEYDDRTAPLLSAVLEGTKPSSWTARYRQLSPDPSKGSPLDQWGVVNRWRLGNYWTVPVEVPLSELITVKAKAQTKARIASIKQARKNGIVLPPIELAVFTDGSTWIVDGNHRLLEARQAGLSTLPVTFTFVEGNK